MAFMFPWLGGEGQQEGLPVMFRTRDVHLNDAMEQSYPHLLSIKRTYPIEDSTGLPSTAQYEETSRFESDVIDAVEASGAGILVIVRTWNGTIEYILYVRSIDDALDEIEARTDLAALELATDEKNFWREYRVAIAAIRDDVV